MLAPWAPSELVWAPEELQLLLLAPGVSGGLELEAVLPEVEVELGAVLERCLATGPELALDRLRIYNDVRQWGRNWRWNWLKSVSWPISDVTVIPRAESFCQLLRVKKSAGYKQDSL